MKTKKQMAIELAKLAMVSEYSFQKVVERLSKMLLPHLERRYNECMENGGSPMMAAYFITCVTGIVPRWVADLKK